MANHRRFVCGYKSWAVWWSLLFAAGVFCAELAGAQTVSGRVVNGLSGAALPRALVRLNQRAMLTDSLGRFEFQQVTDQNATLMVTKPGFYASQDMADTGFTPVAVDLSGTPTTLQLYPEAIITGIVSTRTGEPLPRMRLSFSRMSYDDSGPHLQPMGFASTNGRGEYRFAGQPGAYRVSLNFSPAGRERSEAVLPLMFPEQSSGEAGATFPAGSGEVRRIDLHARTGTAYPVRLRIDGVSGERPQITVKTLAGLEFTVSAREDRTGDAEARAVQVELPAGSYHLHALSSVPQQQAAEAEANLTVTGQGTETAVLHFAAVASLPIQLQVDTAAVPTGTGLSSGGNTTPPNPYDFAPALRRAGGDETIAPGVRLETRPDRSLALSAPAGVYRLSLHNRGQWYVKSAFYGTTDLLTHDLVVGPGAGGEPIRLLVSANTGRLAGTARLDGTPARAWIYLIANGPSAAPITTLHTRTDGTFLESYMPPGSYTVLALPQRTAVDLTDAEARAGLGGHAPTVQVVEGADASVDLDITAPSGPKP